jgi:hypothetical protein
MCLPALVAFVSLSLALVVPINGPRTRSHEFMLVHSIFPHVRQQAGAPPIIERRVVAPLAPAFVAPGSFGFGLSIAIMGLVAEAFVGPDAVTGGLEFVGRALVLRQQAWPAVPVGPPR